MKEILLEAFKREPTTKGKLNLLRRNGYIPAVVYGGGDNAIPISIKKQDFYRQLHGQLIENILVILNIKDLNIEKRTLIKEIQREFVTKDILHVDFYAVELKKKIDVNIPIRIVGESIGVKEGGVLEKLLDEIKVRCLPTKIPDSIEIDVTNLNIGDSISVKDLEKIPDVEMLTPQESVLVVIAKPIKEEEIAAPPSEVSAEPEVIREKKEVTEEEKEGK